MVVQVDCLRQSIHSELKNEITITCQNTRKSYRTALLSSEAPIPEVNAPPLRVQTSHTQELREYPKVHKEVHLSKPAPKASNRKKRQEQRREQQWNDVDQSELSTGLEKPQAEELTVAASSEPAHGYDHQTTSLNSAKTVSLAESCSKSSH